jgi:PiT family inorganic phosphate transporter
MHNTTLLVLVIATAITFDVTNGFHDTANAMATSIATGALPPRVAVALSGVLNLLGAFLSVSVAATIASGIVDSSKVTLPIVLAGLLGAILWNVLTWYFGLPSSSSHALVGGVLGATIAAAGLSAIKGSSVLSKVVIPALLSPVIAGVVAAVATFVAYRVARPSRRSDDGTGPDRADPVERTFRFGQLASASLVSLAHGTNDAQKTMGVVTLALIVDHRIPKGSTPPAWVIVTCAVAIATGTYLGGWRVIRTLGHRLTDIQAPQGFCAETASAAVLLISTRAGVPLSTTHITTGSVIGSGLGRRAAEVRWGTAARMVVAWVVTIPAAALVGGVIGRVTKTGNLSTAVIAMAIIAVMLAAFYVRSRRDPVTARNVNEVRTPGRPVPASVHA